MILEELRLLVEDGPVEPDCFFCCDPASGVMVHYCGGYVHDSCMSHLIPEVPMILHVGTTKTHGDDYPIYDKSGNVIGVTATLYGPEQREAIAKAAKVGVDAVKYKGEADGHEVWESSN